MRKERGRKEEVARRAEIIYENKAQPWKPALNHKKRPETGIQTACSVVDRQDAGLVPNGDGRVEVPSTRNRGAGEV